MIKITTVAYSFDERDNGYCWEIVILYCPGSPGSSLLCHPDNAYPPEFSSYDVLNVKLIEVNGEPALYYHKCHAPKPTDDHIEALMYEALDKMYVYA